MAAHQSLQPLTAAALCWGESITGVGSAALDQSPGRPSPACGHCVISFEGRAEPVRKLLAPKMFPEESQLGTGIWSTTLRGSLLWVLWVPCSRGAPLGMVTPSFFLSQTLWSWVSHYGWPLNTIIHFVYWISWTQSFLQGRWQKKVVFRGPQKEASRGGLLAQKGPSESRGSECQRSRKRVGRTRWK